MTLSSTRAPDPDLFRYLPAFAASTVVVVGDIMLDRYVYGDVRRISPEAPIPVLHAHGHKRVLGGAGNVTQNVAALGARAVLIAVVGEDDAAAEIRRVLAESPYVTERLISVPARTTTIKTRFMSGSHQLLRLDEEVVAPIPPDAEQSVLAEVTAALPRAGALVLSDYAKGVLTDRVLSGCIAAARAIGCPVIADPKRASFAAYGRVNVLTPNEGEVTRATAISADDDAGASAAGEAARVQADADAVLVTRSAKGLTLVRRTEAPLHLPTEAREVADVSGAGDTMVAALAIMLAAGAVLPEAAMMANAAAGISVGKPGTATVSHAELAAWLNVRAKAAADAADPLGKVTDMPAALAQVAAWRDAGLRVGFTNGCFDLIHPGHVRLLTGARAACDRLIVALNTDASVRRLKGPSRPVQDEDARALVMAALSPVDLVVLFGEDTPEATIAALLPDVLVKGADYRLEDVVGRSIVEARGGRVVLVPLEAGFSTTGTIRRATAIH